MATPDWIASTEEIVGASHPTKADTKNRCGQTIYAALDVEHTASTGMHDARVTGLVGEIGTFTGNGAARTITLSNTGLTPKKAMVWEAGSGAELVSNGGFDSDTTGWSTTNSTIASVAGGQSGNCLEITMVSGASQAAYQVLALVSGRSYTFSGYVKSGTSGDEAYEILFGSYTIYSGSSTGSWVQFSGTITYDSSAMGVPWIQLVKDTATAGTMLFDTISVTSGGAAPICIDTMPDEKAKPSRYSQDPLAVNLVDNFQPGSFDVEGLCNTNGITNYYCVLGLDITTVPVGDTGAGSNPTWIPSHITSLMQGEDDATLVATNYANYCESEVWTEFIEEHTAAGVHSITLQNMRIETGTYDGTGTSSRTITLTNDIDIQYLELFVFTGSSTGIYFKSESMTTDTTKIERVAAFNSIITLGTGSFDVNSTGDASGASFAWIAIGV